MSKIAFVFAGQGAQAPGMGKSLYETYPAARKVFDTAESIRPGTLTQCFEGTPEELAITQNTQPCLYCVDLAAAEALRAEGIIPAAAAGFSLGELAALTFSGAASPEVGFSIVCRRAHRMQQAAEQAPAAMAAVVKLPNSVVEELCSHYSAVYPVNYNSPGQLVVAGDLAQLEPFKEEVKAAGGRAIPLKVSGGFHSPFMAPAAQAFAQDLLDFPLDFPKIPLYANVTAAPYAGDPKSLLARQIQSPVRWQETVEHMLAAGIDTFIEVGPGKTLCGLIAKIAPGTRTLQVEDAASLESTLTILKGRSSSC